MREWEPGALGDAHRSLNQRLALPARGDEQDWFLELADQDRIAEFLTVLRNGDLTSAERHELLNLIVASYELHLEEKGHNTRIENDIKALVQLDEQLYAETTEYWTSYDKVFTNCFK